MAKDVVKLVLRLPKGLHRHLVQRAKRNMNSLNTEILEALERSRNQPQMEEAVAQAVKDAFARAIRPGTVTPRDIGPDGLPIKDTEEK
jgi:peptidyl-tRNA hydrolase